MTGLRVRKRHAALLRDLPAPVPFDARALCEGLAERRGRSIRLIPVTGLGDLCGMWVATDTADLIFHEADTTPPHQDHIILHEVAHLLCDHYPASLSVADHARVLLPDLDPDMVRRVLGRAAYSTVEEREAELLASLIRQRDVPDRTLTGSLRSALDGWRYG
ncbi:hypothetical protein ALI22I_17540 [Saccharothrix sp. ALI-22-I]|uniref:hypothetical protein n=1 Tax=Saccharothrix sp. ALI-22-I TaxID=1933778 RepID=UPI00097C56B4|nr:hypothetical protein [Saccharothrix sp. ALI-22-I]ONI88787.1 hypothetical protein ALI22I_17540 [Saccharothrix sp. ALI-22-I]